MRSIAKLTLLFVMVLSLSAAGTLLAQGMQGQRDTGMVPGVKQNQLSQSQRQQIMQIRQQTQQQVRQIRMNQNLTQQQKQQQISQAQAQGHQQIMDVLTPEQKAEFQNWWQQRQQCPGGVCPIDPGASPAGGGAGPGMRGQMQGQMGMVPGLQQNPLSQDQRQQIMQMRQQAQQQMRDVTNDPNLTQDQKWDQIQQIQRQTHDNVVNTLTPEQRQEFDNWWRGRQQMNMGQQGGMGQGMGQGMHGGR